MANVPNAKIIESKTAPASKGNVKLGLLLSLIVIPVGIALWVLIWSFGFMASFVSFAIAWLAIYLYTLGAKSEVTRRTAPYILGVIVSGIILAFLGGMASDAVGFYVEDTDMSQWSAILSADYWMFFVDNLLHNGELWSSYFMDILIALGFGLLGCYGVIKDLFIPKVSSTVEAK